MYFVIVGNVIENTCKTFKQAFKSATEWQKDVKGKIPVYIAKIIVKDGVVIDK